MTSHEIRILGRGCRQARKYGLFREFKDQYRAYRRMKAQVEDAVLDALYDWDLLEITGEGDIDVSLGLAPETTKESP